MCSLRLSIPVHIYEKNTSLPKGGNKACSGGNPVADSRGFFLSSSSSLQRGVLKEQRLYETPRLKGQGQAPGTRGNSIQINRCLRVF